MKKGKIQIIKLSILSAFFLLFNHSSAQETNFIKGSKIYTSADITIRGPQVSIAYDFCNSEGSCFGLSVSQLDGIQRYANDNTLYYNSSQVRLNVSVRYSKVFFNSHTINTFYILKSGLSYNTKLIEGSTLILPSFNVGGGIDIKLIKSSGIRIEAGIGAPYLGSIGYFFTM